MISGRRRHESKGPREQLSIESDHERARLEVPCHRLNHHHRIPHTCLAWKCKEVGNYRLLKVGKVSDKGEIQNIRKDNLCP